MATMLKPVWAEREMRLDPGHLPQMVSYGDHDAHGEVTMTIDRRGVRMRRTLERSALPVAFLLPPGAFRGVAARAMEEDGEVLVTLELLHSDPSLSVPLLVSSNLDDIASDWHSWAEAYGLPMLMVESDGVARPLEETVNRVRNTDPQSALERAPRFLARSGNGSLGMRMVVNGEEMISRH